MIQRPTDTNCIEYFSVTIYIVCLSKGFYYTLKFLCFRLYPFFLLYIFFIFNIVALKKKIHAVMQRYLVTRNSKSSNFVRI